MKSMSESDVEPMADDALPAFGDLLRQARRHAGLTHEALAERAGLSVRGISDLERGLIYAPRKDTLVLLADALDLPAGERRRWEQVRLRNSTRSAKLPDPLSEPKVQTNLPTPLTTLVGRARQVDEVAAFLRRLDLRLLTITGTGGIGKTRLALEVGHLMAAEFADGVWFVNLAPLSDQELVPSTIAATLGITSSGNQTPIEALSSSLRAKRLLLVLDNLEQIVAAVPTIADLLATCPRLTILATSRVPMHLSGEQEYPLEPLDVPATIKLMDTEQLLESAAVSLFVSRAQAVKPDFVLTPANAETVVAICRHLDGLPLALELAAARIRVLPPTAILRRLGQRLSLLRSEAYGVPARHRTLRDTIAWSYELLAPEDQRLFRVLSIFQGGWTLEAAEAVVGSLPSDCQVIDVLDALERLIEHSLVRVREQPGSDPRYTMLETIREYGLERLAAHAELDVIQPRVAHHYLNLFEGAIGRYSGTQGAMSLARCEAERDNVRAVLGWAVGNDAGLAIRLSVSLYPYWWRRGHYGEARRWFELALRSGQPISAPTRAYGLQHMGLHSATMGDHAVAQSLIEEARALFDDLDDRKGIAGCYFGLGRIAMFTGDPHRALQLYEEGIPISRDASEAFLNGMLINACEVATTIGDFVKAARYYEEGLDQARSTDNLAGVAVMLTSGGILAMKMGDLARARQLMDDGLLIHRDHLPERRYATQALEERAWLAAVEQQPERAARLLGAASQERVRMGVPMPRSLQVQWDLYIPPAQTSVDTLIWERAWQEGRAMSLTEAISYALGDNA